MDKIEEFIYNLNRKNISAEFKEKDGERFFSFKKGKKGIMLPINLLYRLLDEFTVEKVIEKIEFRISQSDCLKDAIECIKDYNYSKFNIVAYFLNANNNIELLNRVPHIKTKDMSICFKIKYDIGNGAIFTDVTNDLLSLWGITEEYFLKNVKVEKEYCSPVFRDNCESELFFTKYPKINDTDMFVVSNKNNTFGSGILLNDIFLNKMYQINGEFYFIIINSNEFIVLKGVEENLLDCSKVLNSFNDFNKKNSVSNNIYSFDGSAINVVASICNL